MSRTSRRAKPEPIAVGALRVIKLAVDPEASVADIGEAVTSDPALSLRVLALVNSAAFMLNHKVSDIPRAVGLLGARGLKNIALSLVVADMAPPTEEGRLLLANSARRAAAARAIGAALGARHLDEYFTAGLLLDIGLLASGADDLAWAASVADRPAAHRVVIERAAGRTSHPESGANVARDYSLPDTTIEAIAHHHDETPPEDGLAKACWLAERFAGVFEGGDLVAAKRKALEDAASIGIDNAASEQILEELPTAVADSAAALDRDLGQQPGIQDLIEDANRSLVSLNQHYELLVRQLQQLVDEKEELEEQLRAANKRLAEEAATDPLTQLPNKRALESALARDLARAARSGESLSMIVLDIDHFKRFNDDYGHSTGDEVLRSTGHLLKQCMRTGDYPARYGGEEFVVVLPSTDIAGAQIAAERIRVALEAMRLPDPNIPSVTGSFGVATVQGGDCEKRALELFETADRALYAAKEGGRNRVCVAFESAAAQAQQTSPAVCVA